MLLFHTVFEALFYSLREAFPCFLALFIFFFSYYPSYPLLCLTFPLTSCLIYTQTFNLRPGFPIIQGQDTLLHYPDELMIDWRNTPLGSTANIYWPQVTATDVLQLASQLYASHLLSAADANTLQCKVTQGVTYIPIPSGSGQNFAGLLTIDLPPTVVKGQEFNIIIHRITTRRFQEPPPIQIQFASDEPLSTQRKQDQATLGDGIQETNWRYVTGTFQVKIPVTTADVLLPSEENTLAIFKWRLQAMSPTNRWYPVLQRYISYVAARVGGLGGDPDSIPPSLNGAPGKHEDPVDSQHSRFSRHFDEG